MLRTVSKLPDGHGRPRVGGGGDRGPIWDELVVEPCSAGLPPCHNGGEYSGDYARAVSARRLAMSNSVRTWLDVQEEELVEAREGGEVRYQRHGPAGVLIESPVPALVWTRALVCIFEL